jgi:hypothetical protein
VIIRSEEGIQLELLRLDQLSTPNYASVGHGSKRPRRLVDRQVSAFLEVAL